MVGMIKLTEEQKAKLVFIGKPKCMFSWSRYEEGKLFIDLTFCDEKGEMFTKQLRQANKKHDYVNTSPFACFATVEDAIIAMLDKSGKYYWE